MKGKILDFNEELKTGQILGQDGNRYTFNFEEWKSKNKNPDIDSEVDFIAKNNIAIEIFSLNSNYKKTTTKPRNLKIPYPSFCTMDSYLIKESLISQPFMGFAVGSLILGVIFLLKEVLIMSLILFIITGIIAFIKNIIQNSYMKRINENLNYLKSNIKVHDIYEINMETNESIIKVIEGQNKEELEYKLYVSAFLEGVSDIIILEKEELSSSSKAKVKFLK